MQSSSKLSVSISFAITCEIKSDHFIGKIHLKTNLDNLV